MAPRSDPTLFDRWSVGYDRPGLQRLAYRPVHDAVMARLERMAPAVVLDLGCGTGQLTRRLCGEFVDATIVGADLSEGMLAEAASRLARIGGATPSLVRADADDLPFTDSSVDLVVCTESFHWYPDQARAADELARVLAPGGRVLIASIATYTGPGDRLLRSATAAGGRTVRALPPSRMRRLLVGAGFDVVHQGRVPRLGLLPWPVLTEAQR